ncbi:MAG TPA: PEP-CTERM sorting domain-containing protein [Lacipirellulaceae bacterium]|nr:PEP-CTERM sorting domain-containing protein [Lacipirellulaceae bacterium]
MKAIQKRMMLLLALVAATMLPPATAVADPLPGRDVLKFSQRPMDGTTITTPDGVNQRYWGHDEMSTAYGSAPGPTVPQVYQGRFMADDFADKFSSPVVHVKWWGSYLNNLITPNTPVDKFLISFEKDVPAGPDNQFSRPGEPLLNQIVRRVPAGGTLTPGSGTFTESPVSGGGPPLNERLFEYNAELHLGKEFRQEPDTVYWLKIVALVDSPFPIDPNEPLPDFLPRWGWHNRDYTLKNSLASTAPAVVPGEHIDGFIFPSPIPEIGTEVWHFQDDAVTGRIAVNVGGPMGQVMPVIDQSEYRPTRYLALADGPQVVTEFSKDLAFELYTIVPEPATCALIIFGLAAVTAFRRRSLSA